MQAIGPFGRGLGLAALLLLLPGCVSGGYGLGGYGPGPGYPGRTGYPDQSYPEDRRGSQARRYRPENLDRGDLVRIQARQQGNDWLADRIWVERSVRER